MSIEINNILNAAETANKKGRLNDAIAKLIEAFRAAYPATVTDYALDTEEKVIIQRIQDSPDRRAFTVDTGSLTADEAKAHLEAVVEEIQNRGTCEPCTPTDENPTGVAEAPVLTETKAEATETVKLAEQETTEADVGVETTETTEAPKAKAKAKTAKDGE